MRTSLRRLLLFFCVLRYGARLLWLAAPQDDKVRWIAAVLARLHASPHARKRLDRALPQLAPLARAFVENLANQPEIATHTLHDALDALGRMEAELTTALSPDEAQRALQAALGQPVEAVFESIDWVPLESGLANQIHAARLRSPQSSHPAVAVKLAREREVAHLEDDVAVLGWVAALLERGFPAARELGLATLVTSFGADLMRRFDLRAEAANLSQAGRHFSDDARVVVPDVLWELCTDTTLVVQRIETLPITDVDGLRRHGIDLEQLGEHVVEVVIEQAFEHGFFHAALDARRIRVSLETETLGRLVLADCSIMSSLTEPEREFFVHGATALFSQDYGTLAGMHHEVGHVAPGTRPEQLEAELRMRSEAHFAAHPERRRAGALLHQLIDAVRPFGGDVPAALALAQSSLARAEALARTLAPELDTWRVVERALAELARKDLDHRGWLKRLSRELPHLAPIVPRLPLLIAQRLQRRHEQRDRFDSAAWLRQLRGEEQRTRRLLLGCAVCGSLLGAAAVLLTR